MQEVVTFGKTLPEAYHSALFCLENDGEIADCADWGTTQKEVSMTMIVGEPLAEPRISKLFIGGPLELEQYRQEMLDGILDFEIEKGNWDYTYHDRMTHYVGRQPAFVGTDKYEFLGVNIDGRDELLAPVRFIDQITFVINELKRNPSSRRAVVLVRDPSRDMFSQDPACLQMVQYFIRDNKLHCKVLFRSNDACKATFMNAFALICLQERIAKELRVGIGQYVHRANSFHVYEQDFDMLKGYVQRMIAAEDKDDLCYEYDGDWKEEMESYKEEIARKVEELRNRGAARNE